jgi:hypothetical protein
VVGIAKDRLLEKILKMIAGGESETLRVYATEDGFRF